MDEQRVREIAMTTERFSYSDERLKIAETILIVFFGLLTLGAMQFSLHYSQTKDLQRRVGSLEQRIQQLEQKR